MRMLARKWTISHRCGWIWSMYMKCHSNYLVCMHKSLFYQFPICNLFIQHVIFLHAETPLVNYGYRSCISFIAKQQSTNTLFIYCSLLYCKHCFPHHTFNPLWSAKPVGLTTSLFCWGKVSFVLCAGSTLPTSHSLTNKFNGAVVGD